MNPAPPVPLTCTFNNYTTYFKILFFTLLYVFPRATSISYNQGENVFFLKDPKKKQIFFFLGEECLGRLMGPLANWASSFWLGKEKAAWARVPSAPEASSA